MSGLRGLRTGAAEVAADLARAQRPTKEMRILTWMYRRLGPRYPKYFLCVELMTAYPVAAGTLALFSIYYRADLDEYLRLLVVIVGLVTASLFVAVPRSLKRMRPLASWIEGQRDPESTARAWAIAVGLPLSFLRQESVIPMVVLVLPANLIATFALHLSIYSLLPFLFGSLVAFAYAAVLHYLAIEAGMRPLLIDINREVSPRLRADVAAMPLRLRLMGALPLINVISGLAIASLTGGEGANLGADVLVVLGVAATVSLELTIMLSKSILRPLSDISRATSALAEGDYDHVIPVTTADEFGELAASFNAMVGGLRERERIREAFGTYLDKEVAEYILSDAYAEEGFEAEVSVIFCDVKGFTGFAERVDAREVVAALNELFEVVVPVIAHGGGHVDKFEGDGLMAVFGAPRDFADHSERAVQVALEIDRRVNRCGEGGELEIGIGVNTGTVLAGAIGGGGRLNFSVIGEPVNVAARVEAQTRRLGDNVLITAATFRMLRNQDRFVSRGEFELRGLERPVELFAAAPEQPPRRPSERSTGEWVAGSLG